MSTEVIDWIADTIVKSKAELPAKMADLATLPGDFHHGDFMGNQESAVADAIREGAKSEGVRAQIYAMQASMGDMQEVDCPLQHQFVEGAYMRTIFIPAGTLIVGKIHRHAHFNILSKGKVAVLTESMGLEHLEGPVSMVSPPATKRVVLAITDVTWTTIHLTHETDLEKIENEIISKTFGELS